MASIGVAPPHLTSAHHTAHHLPTLQGYWYEVYSHNVFLVDACHCTRYVRAGNVIVESDTDL